MLPTPRGATKPAKPCHATGCPNKVKGSTYCPDHSHLSTSRFQNKKGPTHPWYQKAIWKKRLRPNQLKRNPLCNHCEEQGIITPATVVNHIEEWKNGSTRQEQWNLFVDTDNHESLCDSCHNSYTAKRNKG